MYQLIMNLSDYLDNIPRLIAIIVGYLLATAVFIAVINPLHNLIQYYIAHKSGDNMVKEEGLVSFSVGSSFHWIGAFSVLVLRMGFSAPIMYNREKFTRPKLQTVLMSLSGIFTYLLCALVLQLIYSLLSGFQLFGIASNEVAVDTVSFAYVYYILYLGIYYLARFCLCSAIFNLIPFVPMDMGDILYMFFNYRWFDALCNNEMLVSTVVFAISFFTIGAPGGIIQNISGTVLNFVFANVMSLFT